jgi:hypothetical protein
MDVSSDAPEEKASLSRPVSIKRIREGRTELEQRARQAGLAAGTMVALLRNAKKRFSDNDLWKTTNPLSDLRPTATGLARELQYAGALRAQEWRRAALERMSQLPRPARFGLDQTPGRHKRKRRQAIPMLAAAGVIGFLLGAGLKAWQTRAKS